MSIASLRLSLILPNSSFASILNAWKTLVFDFGSKLDFSIKLASSEVVVIGFSFLVFKIASTMKGVFFSSQYEYKIFLKSVSEYVFTISAALIQFDLSNLRSRGPSNLKENHFEALSRWTLFTQKS
jgi:energy-coupling factor transporter transmembrane protein EcfT